MGNRIGTGIPGGLLIPAKITHDQLQPVATPPTPIDSSYSQSTSRPGHGVPIDDLSRLVAHVHGSQSADFLLRTIKAGMPGRDGLQMAYRKDSEAGTQFRGWNPPNYPNGVAYVAYGSTPAARFDAVTIPSTQQIVVFDSDGSTPGTSRTIDPVTRAVSVGGSTVGLGDAWNYPALVVIPETERILLQFGDTIRYSDDLGATWNGYSESPTPEDAATDFGRSRMAFYRSDIGMLIEDIATPGDVHQWASSDIGSTFVEVKTHVALGSSVAYASSQDGVFVFYLRAADSLPIVRRLSTPFEDLSTVDEVEVVGVGLVYAEGSITADPNGTLWVHVREDATGDLKVYRSVDAGSTWGKTKDSLKTPSSSAYLTNYKGVSSYGSVVLFSNWFSATSAKVGLQALWLGGWHAVTANGGQPPASRRGFEALWTPIELPQNTGGGWTEIGGASTLVTPGEMRRFTNGVAPNLSSYHTFTGTAAVSQLILTQVRVELGGSLSNKDVAIHGTISQLGVIFEWSISLSTTGYRVRDEVTAAQVGGDELMDLTADIVLLVWATDLRIVTYWWRPGESTVNVGPAGALASGVGATTELRWGHEDSGGIATSFWSQFHFHEQPPTVGLPNYRPYEPQTGIANVKGKPMTRDPVPVPDLGSTPLAAFLSATSGPARRDDGYDMDAEYDFPITNVFPRLSPSPDSRWRSVGTAEQILTFKFDQEMWLGDSIGMYISGANFRTAVLESSIDGSSWTARGTMNLAEGFEGLDVIRTGETLTPGATADADRYLFEESLTGGWVDLPGAPAVQRRVASQSAGGWTTATTAKPVITLEGVLGSDPISATAVKFVFPSGLLVIHLTSQVLVPFWRVRIPAQSTPDGYIEAGIIMVGKIAAFGDRIDWGRGYEMIPNTAITRDNYGTTRARELGPPSRRWSLHWQSGTNHCEIRTGPDVDYVGPTVGIPMVGDEDVLYRLFGHIQETRGGEIPCLAIEEIPDANTTINDATRMLYGRLTSSARGNNTAGDLGVDEQQRIESLVFEEIK